jgi:hypothetical protein
MVRISSFSKKLNIWQQDDEFIAWSSLLHMQKTIITN